MAATDWTSNPLGLKYFHKSRVMQNTWQTFCKGCVESEALLMDELAKAEGLAEAEEDARPDDGAVEIPSDDEYRG